MTEKKIGKSLFYWGKTNGFGIGFQISKYNFDLTLGFWYLGFEF